MYGEYNNCMFREIDIIREEYYNYYVSWVEILRKSEE